MSKTYSVLVAGIGGGSLGVEIGKALRLAGRYRAYGCDISPLAFGHYSGVFDRTEVVPIEGYAAAVLDLCKNHGIDVIVPGGDQPTTLLAAASERFSSIGVRIASNDPCVVETMGDKERCFRDLAARGFAIPKTVPLDDSAAVEKAPLPCIVKPSTGSGGSAFVFFAHSRNEVRLYDAYLRSNGRRAIAQEYVPEAGGEFTAGVLSAPDGSVRGAIVLKRAFPAKLSVAARSRDFLISSGITQGRIGDYPAVSRVVTEIAAAVGSTGPLNVQGRVDSEGRFLPFEINPRFSASTFLRALAGFNEVDYYIQLLFGEPLPQLAVRAGWYLRGLSEVYVEDESVLV